MIAHSEQEMKSLSHAVSQHTNLQITCSGSGATKKFFACSDNNRVETILALPNRKPKRTINEGNSLPNFSWCNESSV